MRRDRQTDLIDQQIQLDRRVRALETGAHPTAVLRGGFGRQRGLAKLTPRPPYASYAAPGDSLLWRVHTDTVHFGSAGDGMLFTLGAGWATKLPFLFARIGPAGWPSWTHLLVGELSDAPCLFTVDGLGYARLVSAAGFTGTGPFTSAASYPLG